jgi:hypothetical protein
MLFPCIEEYAMGRDGYADWIQWTENLMMDKNMYYNRPVETRIAIPREDVKLVRILFLLTHIRKVLLQDGVALMEHPDAPFRYGDHVVFKHPAFSLGNPLFRKFKDDLCNSMRNARSPMEDSLIANAPAIHNEFRTVHSSVLRVDHTLQAATDAIQDLTKKLESVAQQITNKVTADGHSLDRVYEFMEKIGSHIVQTARRERRRPQDQQQQQSSQPEQQVLGQGQGQGREQGQGQEQRYQEHGLVQLAANTARGCPTLEERVAELEIQLASQYVQSPPRTLNDVDRTMLPRSSSLQQHWDEWFKGVEGRPSLWILNKTFKSKWRQGGGNTLTKTFSFKKTIITSVLKLILNEEANGGSVAERETRVLQFLTKGLNSGTTLNQYYLLLQKKSEPEVTMEDP